MAQYKLIEISKTVEKETQSIYDKDDLTIALNEMHNDFGTNVKLDATIGAYVTLINNETAEQVDCLQWGEPVKDRVYTHNNFEDDNIAGYDSEKLAIGNYHTRLSRQRSNKDCIHAITIRLDGNGKYKDFDCYNAPTE